MMTALVTQLGGELEYQDNEPGLRVVLSAPVVP
jgi:two-component sensor histidine kinase